MKYSVTFWKAESYDVEANSMDEAEELAIELLDDDTDAFMFDPPDKIIVEEVK